jgi:hypothetical protein
MSDEGQLTISSLLVYLRQTLIDARKEKNEKLLAELGNTFDLIEAASYEAKDKKHAAIAEEMRCAVRDAFMGTQWKSNIPSIEDIQKGSQ